MARFFIDRPIFAWVIAILIMMAGALALRILPVAQYPNIAAPEVSIRAIYPGASAKTVEESVTQVIEQQMKGLDNLMYMYSTSDSAGMGVVNFAFEAGTDIDIAQVQIQNKLQLAMPLLPEAVQRQGISVNKSVRNFLLVVSFISEDGSMTNNDLSDYVASYLQDPIGRLPGVGETTLYGAQYAMRIWCDPEKFLQYNLNPSDVVAAVQQQNAQVAGGQFGAGPAVAGQEINFTINAASRLETVEQFKNIILRTNEDGSILYLKDVAKVEKSGQDFLAFSRYNGMPATGLAIKLASGANALDTIAGIKTQLESMAPYFPTGLGYRFAYDTGPVVSSSIRAVFMTLGEAIVLVFLIMLLFLQNLRATIIPTIAIPVVLLGTFGVLAAAGYSINSLTMFGMVLAIGLLVDDAIVVVENVERIMREEGLGPKEAAKKSMDQITGALVGVAMVISAVFVPMAFMGGSTGVIYRQFAITIVTAMILSVVVAIVLTPAMCATMLSKETHPPTRGFFGRFNRWFEKVIVRYKNQVAKVITKPRRYLAVFGVCLVLIVFMFWRLPSAFLPEEDQGIIMCSVELPPGATFERTSKVLSEIEAYFLQQEGAGISSILTVTGVSLSGFGQNSGFAFVKMKDWSERGKGQDVFSVAARASGYFSTFPEAIAFAIVPPAILELGSSTGFDFQLMDMAGLGHEALMAARDTLLAKARANPNLTKVRHNGLSDVDQYDLHIDLAKAGAQGLNKGDINTAIAAYWGSVYINDFIDRGRTKKVYIQSEAPYRMQPSDFKRYYVRNDKGQMVPFSSFLTMDTAKGSPRLERFRGIPSVEIMGEAIPGKSSGEAMNIMENLAEELPEGFGYGWTGLSYQELLSGNQAPLLYAISLAVVFLSLAALYESWTIPLSVLLVVPTGVIGALLGVSLRGMYNDIYFQIGLLTIIGLSAKNSILIVEFARAMYKQGMDMYEATVQAARMRLRPILMTSLCFILGVVPLAISRGAGSGGQNAIGTTVMCGMIAATGLGVFFTPIFFILVTRLFMSKKKRTPVPTNLRGKTDAVE